MTSGFADDFLRAWAGSEDDEKDADKKPTKSPLSLRERYELLQETALSALEPHMAFEAGEPVVLKERLGPLKPSARRDTPWVFLRYLSRKNPCDRLWAKLAVKSRREPSPDCLILQLSDCDEFTICYAVDSWCLRRIDLEDL